MAVRVSGRPADLCEVKCTGCGFLLEYLPGDVFRYRHDVDDEKSGYIICPRSFCKKPTHIPYVNKP